MFQPDGYRKFLLNRATATQPITEYIENCITSDDDGADYAFHKIMVLHFADKDVNLFNIISEYFEGYLIPVHYQAHNIMTTFYTSNLKLILKIVKLDFIFPYNRNMYNIDILFNDKTAVECFGTKMKLDDVVSEVVSERFNEHCELNLSDFCNDPVFKQYNIYFYKLSLLTNFKLLMLRMGRDTKTLNLSNNKLSQVPQDILNFFIKGGLTAIDFSNNLIPSLNELQRVSSRIEKLWLEGNPLCEELDATSYIKQLFLKFPRLTELDGVRLNNHGVTLPFYRNFLVTPDKRTKVVVEKFITLYFSLFDGPPQNREQLQLFYDQEAHLSISVYIPESEKASWPVAYAKIARNMMSPVRQKPRTQKKFRDRQSVLQALCMFPATAHDLSSFTVDVLMHSAKNLMIIVDGVLQEITTDKSDITVKQRHLSFRRTFLFAISHLSTKAIYEYIITKEMFSLMPASQNQIQDFKEPPKRNTDRLTLMDPEKDDIAALSTIFMHITQLKSMEQCEIRLRAANWNIKQALDLYQNDVKNDTINPAKMIDNDDFSDTSSLLEDEID